MQKRFVFDRMELAGSLGDLGTLLPIAAAMVLINGLSPTGLFFSIGVFYILAGIFFGVTVPVQPMKVIGAYAIATAMQPEQIQASTLLMAAFLLIVSVTGTIEAIRKMTPKSVIRGVQLSTGAILIAGGIKLMLGTSTFQVLQHAAEPYLAIQKLGWVPIGLVIGAAGGVVTLLLLENRKYPSGLVVVLGGMALGLALGTHVGFETMSLGVYWPAWMPFGFPALPDFSFALFTLVLPQLPMTLGNAVFAYTDLSRDYFGKDSARVTNRNACLSMAAANCLSFAFGGMPLCHGAGGLAAHYRFGARTAGSNIMIGTIFVGLTIVLGKHIVTVIHLIPMAVLGILLVFAGLQLAMTIMDLEERRDFFVAMIILGITLATNLAAGFLCGIAVAYLLKWERLSV
ncbi:MAG: putative sulfate/molybdate transporter [Pseudomonadota bacterium]